MTVGFQIVSCDLAHPVPDTGRVRVSRAFVGEPGSPASLRHLGPCLGGPTGIDAEACLARIISFRQEPPSGPVWPDTTSECAKQHASWITLFLPHRRSTTPRVHHDRRARPRFVRQLVQPPQGGRQRARLGHIPRQDFAPPGKPGSIQCQRQGHERAVIALLLQTPMLQVAPRAPVRMHVDQVVEDQGRRQVQQGSFPLE